MTLKDLEHEVVAGTIGVSFSIVCVAFFAYFIHHVATAIQVNKLIDEGTYQALKTAHDRLKPNGNGEVLLYLMKNQS
jgi:uncharacterized membrane protein